MKKQYDQITEQDSKAIRNTLQTLIIAYPARAILETLASVYQEQALILEGVAGQDWENQIVDEHRKIAEELELIAELHQDVQA